MLYLMQRNKTAGMEECGKKCPGSEKGGKKRKEMPGSKKGGKKRKEMPGSEDSGKAERNGNDTEWKRK